MKDVSKNQALSHSLQELIANPEQMNAVMDNWNDLFSIPLDGFEEVMNTANSGRPPPALEAAATTALNSIAKRDHANEARADVALLLNRFPHAAMLVDRTGCISATNDYAFNSLHLDAGDKIDSLPCSLMEAELLSDVVSSCLAKSIEHSGEYYVLKTGIENKTKRAVSLAIVPSQSTDGSSKSALVFLVDPEWREDSAEMLKRAYGLTNTEMIIIGSFMAGKSLRDISEERGRSLATVRTQLQNILNKVGATNQLDLFRIVMGLSQFVRDIDPMIKIAVRSERPQFDVLRPNKRSVDVMFFGDRDGTPVIFVHTLFHRTLTPTIEQCIAANRMHFIVPGKPGYGKTSFQPEGQSMAECYVDDVRAVLDQMGVDKFSILAMVSGSPFMFALCNAMPERIIKACCMGGAVPAPYIRNSSITSKWTLALASATKVSPQMAKLMSKSGMRLIKAIGVSRFMARLNSSSEIDREVMTRDDVVEELRTGFDWISMQGLQAPLEVMTLCFDDWRYLVDGVSMEVTMLQGHHDPHANIASLQSFSEAYPEIVKLYEFPDGGQSLIFTHTQQVLDALQDVPKHLN